MSRFDWLSSVEFWRRWKLERCVRWVLFLLLAGLLGLGGGQSVVGQSRPVPEGARVERVDDGFEFTEGPIWHEGRLLFSDIPANTVYQWRPDEGTTVFLTPSGRANGLARDGRDRLLLAQHDGQVGRYTEADTVAPVVDTYGGKRLNSPNDLAVASDGTIYFTDPPYGIEEEKRQLDFSGVYRRAPDGRLILVTDAFERPNGICLSPDESTLYVNDSRDTYIRAYDVTADGTIENGRLFANPQDADADGTTDGMAVDERGNLYTTGPGGVWVYSPDGTRLARIAVPKPPTNLAFGGPERKTLYITARSHLYRVSVNVPGTR